MMMNVLRVPVAVGVDVQPQSIMVVHVLKMLIVLKGIAAMGFAARVETVALARRIVRPVMPKRRLAMTWHHVKEPESPNAV